MKDLSKTFVVMAGIALALFIIGEAAYPEGNPAAPGMQKAPRVMSQGHPGSINADLQKAKEPKPAENKAKWSQNPNDEREQGNMGKPMMRDPYGFDKDSDRVGSERGRIMEATLNLEEITTSEFTIYDAHLPYLYDLYESWMEDAEANPGHPYAYALAQQTLAFINKYTSYDHEYLVVGWMPWGSPTWPPSTIDYTLTFTPPEGFEGTTLEVTTMLTSINDYDGRDGLHYDAGQVIAEETQDIVLGADNTLDYSYTPPADLVDGNIGFLAELSIIITDPESGSSYTIVYDTPLYVYRFGTLNDNM